MNFKITEQLGMIVVEFGEIDIPQYDFCVPDKDQQAFDDFGLCELMEGTFEVTQNKTEEDVKDFLTNLGYLELPRLASF